MSGKKLRKFRASLGAMRFLIEEGHPRMGWYLHVYTDGTRIGRRRFASLELAKRGAEKRYSVSEDRWREEKKKN